MVNDRASAFTFDDAGECTSIVYREHNDRYAVFPRQRNCRSIHDFQVPRQDIMIAQAIVAFRILILDRDRRYTRRRPWLP